MKHGTYSAYGRHGCRCDTCRAYQNERVRKNRADRLESGRLSHGTQSAWDAGCRCADCARVHKQRHAAYYRRITSTARGRELGLS